MYPVMFFAVAAMAAAAYLIIAGEKKSPEARSNNARLPLFIPVELETFGRTYPAESQDISRGGMLLKSEAPVQVAQPVFLSFTLPDTPPVDIPAVVCHKRGLLFGVKFDPTHPRRNLVEEWVYRAFQEHLGDADKVSSLPNP